VVKLAAVSLGGIAHLRTNTHSSQNRQVHRCEISSRLNPRTQIHTADQSMVSFRQPLKRQREERRRFWSLFLGRYRRFKRSKACTPRHKARQASLNATAAVYHPSHDEDVHDRYFARAEAKFVSCGEALS